MSATGATARALLRLAVRRWPPSTRDALRDEWLAELHVLAARRRPGRMLRFALSLALARPNRERRAPVRLDRRLGMTATTLLLGPLVAFFMAVVAYGLSGLNLFGLVMVAPLLWWAGGLGARAGAAGAVARRRLAVPAVLVVCLPPALYPPYLDADPYGPTLVWAALMAVVLIVVGVLPRPYSWWVGYAGALAAAWAAVTWAVWQHDMRWLDGWRLDPSYAWLWFPASIVGTVYVGAGPRDLEDGSEISATFMLTDFTEVYPHVLVCLGVYAVGYLVGVCEYRDFPEPDSTPQWTG